MLRGGSRYGGGDRSCRRPEISNDDVTRACLSWRVTYLIPTRPRSMGAHPGPSASSVWCTCCVSVDADSGIVHHLMYGRRQAGDERRDDTLLLPQETPQCFCLLKRPAVSYIVIHWNHNEYVYTHLLPEQLYLTIRLQYHAPMPGIKV